jgi:hypothetical protein
MRTRDKRPTIVDQRSIKPTEATTMPSESKRRLNARGSLRSALTSQVSAKSETAAPTPSAALPRSDFTISGEWRV